MMATKKPKKFKSKSWRESATVRKQRLAVILGELTNLYPNANCALHFDNPWELLVATILSAQCTDERVNKETPALFSRYPTVESMAEAPIEDLEQLVKRTGFYRNKARAISESAKAIVDRYESKLPKSMEDLLTLRGVARKTANVVLGTAYGITSGIVVDTHISRLSQRLGLTRQKDPEKIEQDLMKLLNSTHWVFFGHALIWHGRKVCNARKPKCPECSLQKLCPSMTL